MERVVICGAGGFIGSHMVAFLKKRGHFVRAVDIEFPEIRRHWWQQADEVVTTDMRVIDEVSEVVKDMDWVVWLCSDMGGVYYFHTHDYTPFIHNMQMDMNILQVLQVHGGKKRLFYSSSACIYPTHLQKDISEPFLASENEIFPANSDQMYGWEKLMMTMLCERSGLDARVGIFHTIYGPGQEWEGERAKFPPSIAYKAIKAKKTGEKIKLWGNGSQLRTFCYIKDATEKIYKILTQNYHGPVNVAGDELVSVLNTAELLCEIVDIPKQFEYEDSRPSGVLARGADNSKFESLYAYKNKYSLRDGFTEVVEWMQDRI